MSKNAKKKMARKQEEVKAKTLKKAISEGINGYSQEEASKSSGEDRLVSSSDEENGDNLKQFLTKINKAKQFKESKSSSDTR